MLMNLSRIIFLLLVPGVLLAQPGHWRVSLQGGVARGYNYLRTDQPLPDGAFRIPNRSGVTLQLGLERSLTSRFSLRAGFGVVNHPLVTEQRMIFRDTLGNPIALGVGRSKSSLGAVTGSLGASVNSRAYGRLIFTAGTDVVVRVNTEDDKAGKRWGGSSQVTIGTRRIENLYHFRLQSVPPVTLGVSLRAGVDYRISERSMLSLTASYHYGFGFLRRGISDTLRFDGVEYRGDFYTRGSNLSLLVGVKYNLFRANPLAKFTYTPYNGPLLRSGFDTEERNATFRRGAWLGGLSGGGFPAGSAFGRHLYGLRVGYFGLDRTMLGVKAHYLRVRLDDRLTGQWLTVGPLLRYQFTRSRVSPFVEVAYLWGKAWANFGGKGSINSLNYASFTPGLSIRLGPYLRFETALELLSQERFGSRSGERYFQFGLAYQFSNRRP